MKIAFYSSHYFLPFWCDPKNPVAVFNSSRMAKYKATICGRTFFLEEDLVWPVLEGLRLIDLPLLANISLIVVDERQVFDFPERVWVQITTLPECQENGMPIVVEDNEVSVVHLWGGDNGTYRPHGFVGSEIKREVFFAPAFWADFFLDKLKEAKECALKGVRVDEDIAWAYSHVPD